MNDETQVAEGAAEPPRGRVLQTFLVRVTLRANEDGSQARVPTNEQMAAYVKQGLHHAIPEFWLDAINATAEKV